MQPPKSARISAEQLTKLFEFYPTSIASSFLLVLLNSYALWSVANTFLICLWMLMTAFAVLHRGWVLREFKRNFERFDLSRWLLIHEAITTFSGFLWGYGVYLLMPADSLPHIFLFIITIAGLCSGASSTLALSPRAYLFFLICCLFPISIRFYGLDQEYGLLLFGVCYAYMYFMWTTCSRNSDIAFSNFQHADSLKEKEAALNESVSRFDLHFEHSPLGIVEWNSRFIIHRWNPAAKSIFGFTEEQMLGQSLERLLANKDDIAFFSSLDETTHTLVNTNADDQQINCEWSSTAIRLADGTLLGYTSFVRDVTERIEREALINQQAFYDPVTGLPNRYYFENRLSQQLSKSERTDLYSAVFFIDLDHFKTINDSMGHSAGDLLLAQFANRIEERLRNYDTLARFGGDEFVVLLEELATDYEQAQLLAAQVAQSLQSLMLTPFKLEDTDYSMTCSIGISLFNKEATSGDELLKQADLALYQSKHKGRNNYTFFEPEMSQHASRHLELLTSLRDAVERKEMSLVYQPKVDMHTNKIRGAEALIRWNSERFGFVSPAEFIPVIEGSALISTVGMWVLDSAFEQLASWLEAGVWRQDMGLAINISPNQLLEKSFVEQVEVLLAKHNLSAQLIEFEITENVLVKNTDKVKAILMELSDLGVSFSIDDFGTGYSSLAYLKQLPIDVLKIDKSFIDHCTEEGNDQAIVRSVLSICNELKLVSVAEGVETLEQQQQLQQMGCDLLQGYLFSRPLPADELEALIINNPA